MATSIREAESGLGLAQDILNRLTQAATAVGGNNRIVEELFTDYDQPILLAAMALVTDLNHRRLGWIHDVPVDPGESWMKLIQDGNYCSNVVDIADQAMALEASWVGLTPTVSIPITLLDASRVRGFWGAGLLESLATLGYRSATFKELLNLGRGEGENFGRTFALHQDRSLYIESGLDNGQRKRSLEFVDTANLGDLLLERRTDGRYRDYFSLVRDLSVMPKK